MSEPAPSSADSALTSISGYREDSFFVLRTPLLPLSYLDDKCIDNALNIAAFREALLISSASLFEAINFPQRTKAVDAAVQSYMSRAASRATPFGLLAGYAVGKISELSRLRLRPLEEWRRHTYLDGEYLGSVARTARDSVLQQLVVRPNNTLYSVGDTVRFYSLEHRDRPSLVSVENSDVVRAAIDLARHGIVFADLVIALHDWGSFDELSAFATELVEAELLVADFGVTATGLAPQLQLTQQLNAIKGVEVLSAPLQHAVDSLKRIDALVVGSTIDEYGKIQRQLPHASSTDISKLFRSNLRGAGEVALSSAVAEQILRAVGVIHGLNMGYVPNELFDFTHAFARQFGDNFVPILEVFDPEIGLDYPFVSDLREFPFPRVSEPRSTSASHSTASPSTASLVSALIKSGIDGYKPIDVSTLAHAPVETTDPLPNSFFAVASLLGNPTAEPIVYFRYAAGPSGAELLGRLCHGDPQLHHLVSEHVRREEALDPDVIFAEVSHLGTPSLSNIVARPHLRRYEIPFLGHSTVDRDLQIPLADLCLFIRDRRVVLWSYRHQKEVIPRITSPHAYGRPENLILYHFLGALQRQNLASRVCWDWGPLSTSSCLPRVVSESTILSPKRWTLDLADATALCRSSNVGRVVGTLRERLDLPRFVCIGDGDKLTPIDLDHEASVAMIPHKTRHLHRVTFEEFVFSSMQSPVLVESPDAHEAPYANELIVPYLRSERSTNTRCTARLSKCASGTTSVAVSTQPKVAFDVLQQLANRIKSTRDVASWSFAFRRAPNFHIDIELSSRRPLAYIEETLGDLMLSGRVSSIALVPTVSSTSLFEYVDTRDLLLQLRRCETHTALSISASHMRQRADNDCWPIVLVGLKNLLDVAGISAKAAQDLLELMSIRYQKQAGLNASVSHSLGTFSRLHAATVRSWAEADNPEAVRATTVWSASEETTTLVSQLAESYPASEWLSCLTSLLDARASRLLPVAFAPTMVLATDLLRRYYRSIAARNIDIRGAAT